MGVHALENIIICLGFFALVFGYVYIRNRENMALIEKGFNPRATKSTPKPFISLKYGLLLLGFGVGLFLAFVIDTFMVNHNAKTPGGESYERDFPQIYFALIAIFGGLGLLISYWIEKKEWLDKSKD